KGLILWTVEIPSVGFRPELDLRRLIEHVRDDEARTRALEEIDRLVKKRDAVATAAGDPPALDAALDALEKTFFEQTGQQATRLGGQAYAGRTLAYEECTRSTEVVFGPELLQKISGPLGLLMKSARWYTFEIAVRFRGALDRIYDGLETSAKTPAIDYLRF